MTGSQHGDARTSFIIMRRAAYGC